MIIKHVTQVGDPIIRSASRRVTHIPTKTTQRIVRNLIDSMRAHNLVGMAAPQIQQSLRIFVTEIRKTNVRNRIGKTDPVRIFVNPLILKRSRRLQKGYEGCGSVAEAQLFGEVSRSYEVTVKAWDQRGKLFVLSAHGLLARVIQHEYDHLDGKVFIDRMASFESIASRSEYLRMQKRHKR